MVYKLLILFSQFIKKIIHPLLYYSCYLSFVTCLFSQSLYNSNPTRVLIKEHQSKVINNKTSTVQNRFQVTFNEYFYYNSNLPNLENHNGFYFPKGYGIISGLLFQYHGKYLTFSAEPQITKFREYAITLPEKEKSFSVLNDMLLNDAYKRKINNFRNIGIQFYYQGLRVGFGNWNQWWGPGIHNSLVMTNNSEGFYHYYLGTDGYRHIGSNLEYNFKYLISNSIRNTKEINYFLSAWFLNIKYNNIQIGSSRHILSGGHNDLIWGFRDAAKVLITNKNLKYWDQVYDLYFLYNVSSSGLKVFLELGFPNRFYDSKDPEVYRDHAMGSNLGLRKYGVFGKNELMFGFEYTRLIQGIYYNILPTPNWYDNIKYNYSSYNGRRWAAHSGSDSDDFLIFIGYIDNTVSFIYGLNYERHGVTYHFPSEVKLESRISASFKYNNTYIYLNYENEYFEHYGFVDSNKNVWEETFESGSIQNTHTLFISIEHTFSF